jgi:hypothetical protein
MTTVIRLKQAAGREGGGVGESLEEGKDENDFNESTLRSGSLGQGLGATGEVRLLGGPRHQLRGLDTIPAQHRSELGKRRASKHIIEARQAGTRAAVGGIVLLVSLLAP